MIIHLDCNVEVLLVVVEVTVPVYPFEELEFVVARVPQLAGAPVHLVHPSVPEEVHVADGGLGAGRRTAVVGRLHPACKITSELTTSLVCLVPTLFSVAQSRGLKKNMSIE